MKDPDYVNPAHIAKLRDEEQDAGVTPSRPSVRRPASTAGVAFGATSDVDVTGVRIAKPGVVIKTTSVLITR